MKSFLQKTKTYFAKNKPLLVVVLILVLLAITLFGIKKLGLIANLRKNTPPSIQNIIPEIKQAETIILTVNAGEVTLKTISETRTLPQNTTQDINYGDTVITNANGIATLKYSQGTIVRLAPDSTLTVNEIDITNPTTTTISQTAGTIFVRFKKVVGIQEEINIDTPQAVATVRGTKLISKIDAKLLESKIIGIDNEFEVYKKDEITNKRIDSTKQTLKEGLQAQIGKKGLVRIAKQLLTEDEKRWLELNKDTLDDDTKTEIFRELLSRYLASPSPSSSLAPRPSGSPKPLVSPTPKPVVSYTQGMFGTGYNSGYVKTDSGDYKLSCYGAPQGTRVITDSASESDCKTDCPVLPLADYATRNNGVAAINGMYFCPSDYPACADKKNSFDTLFFNSRVKRYINSDNNIYSSIPFLVINADGSPRFIGRSSEWGRDTGIMAGTAGNPMLVQGGNIAVVEGNLDSKQRTVKSNRGAFVQKAPNIYLCIVGGATVMDSAKVYKTLGVDNAINIDGGGSSALWVNGSYKYGPGRNIPTAIIFAR